ncbi:MAG: tryptophan-rich sensory protein, partial [Firmicutes bacterium]|nr:tryptophan-rich sensory protein [Bacillota bacterium]
MKKQIRWGTLIVCIAIPLAVGAVASLLTKDNMMQFRELEQPPLAPPGWLFPVVWTILYV